jgi:Cu(I)/Ag(I) efflux system periplasmic protein CusF
MNPIRSALLASIAALSLTGAATAQSGAPAPDLADGEVRKVDKDAGRLTLRHGPLKNLDMPGMTMAFKVSDHSLLDKVQAGDKVRFQVEKIDGKLTVTQLEAAR